MHEQVAPVAAEGFVTAVPGEYHGNVLTAHPGHVEGGDGRCVGEGLVEVPGQGGQDVSSR